MVLKNRPVKRLLREQPKAEVTTKKQFKNILWQASRGSLGKRKRGDCLDALRFGLAY